MLYMEYPSFGNIAPLKQKQKISYKLIYFYFKYFKYIFFENIRKCL